MTAKIKCKECLSCMNFIWLGNIRYVHCWLCQTYYTGRNDNLILVNNPFQEVNKPQEIRENEQE